MELYFNVHAPENRKRILDVLNANYIYILPRVEVIGSDEWTFCFKLMYLPFSCWGLKRRASHFVDYSSFKFSGGATYFGGWDSIDQAIDQGINYVFTKLLEEFFLVEQLVPGQVVIDPYEMHRLKNGYDAEQLVRWVFKDGKLLSFPSMEEPSEEKQKLLHNGLYAILMSVTFEQ